LIEETTWQENNPTILKDLGYPKLITPIEALLEDYKKILNPLLDSVNARLKSGENEHVKTQITGEGVKWSLPYLKKESLVNNPFFLQVPQISIVDVLYFGSRYRWGQKVAQAF